MLTDTERALLDFEDNRWKYPGAKEQAIRERFDVSPTRYYQQMNALIDRADALEYAPMLVKRLARLREARVGARTVRG